MNQVTLRNRESLVLDLDDAYASMEKARISVIELKALIKSIIEDWNTERTVFVEQIKELQRIKFDLETDNYELRNRRD